ncbi:MAG: N-acetylmuramoyl-L-alanine amidase [Calothrix sp. C42_A2020_038]|nr:N-acetylmuramoyl-L-alanine amidase [Calothrix sp. C42_A2020_038]
MGRIFISAARGGRENGRIDPGTIAGGTTEAREMILLRDLIVSELQARNWQVLAVPDDLSARGTINWINARAVRLDVALEIQTDAAPNPSVRGASVFYIANNEERKKNAELLLLNLLQRVPQLPNRGVRPDTSAGLGSVPFCRQTSIPALQMQVGFLTSPEDRRLLQSRRRDFALGIADGLISWSRVIDPSSAPSEPNYPSINISIDGKNYPDKGILVNGNSYIPINLADQLQIDLSNAPKVHRISYRQVVYAKANDLRDLGVSVGWDSTTRTLNLKSAAKTPTINEIMSNGRTKEVQLHIFLRNNNEPGSIQFPDIPKLYIEEAAIEGVNHDIAFSQMCLETNYLRFTKNIKPEQNNFAGLGTVGGGSETATFESARIGVRAHIQHLKAYASSDPLSQEVVDPRFRFVTRGVAPIVEQLSGRWSPDRNYGANILAIVRQLYQSAGL